MTKHRFIIVAVAAAVMLGGCSKGGDTGKAEKDEQKQSSGQAGGEGGGQAAAPVKTASGGKVSANFDKVTTGMGEQQVRDLLGAPKNQTSTTTGDKSMTILQYEDGGKEFVVQLIDGKVAVTHQGKQSSSDKEESPAKAEQLSSNFGKVKAGMSEEEVRKLLGAPTSSMAGGAPGMTMMHWEAGNKEYVIMFMNGKVQTTHMGSQ